MEACSLCQRSIPIENFMLHSARCRGPSSGQSSAKSSGVLKVDSPESARQTEETSDAALGLALQQRVIVEAMSRTIPPEQWAQIMEVSSFLEIFGDADPDPDTRTSIILQLVSIFRRLFPARGGADGISRGEPAASGVSAKAAGAAPYKDAGSYAAAATAGVERSWLPHVGELLPSAPALPTELLRTPSLEEALRIAEEMEIAERAARQAAADQAFQQFLLEERRAKEAELAARKYACPLCLDDDVRLEDIITLTCDHRICLSCFQRLCTTKINEAEVTEDHLCCHLCREPFSYPLLKANLDAVTYLKLERFQLKVFIDDERNGLRYCPKCNEYACEVPQGDEDEVIWKEVECPLCSHKYCGKCGEAPHKMQSDIDVTCEAYATWRKENAAADDAFEAMRAKHEFQTCPTCKNAAVLSQGCKFTYCRCKTKFCFLCGVQLEDKHHYSHFQNGPGCTGPYGEVCNGPNDPGLK